MLDTIISGGTVVTPMGAGKWDVGIHGEKIVVVAMNGAPLPEAGQVIDATGKIVVPGGVEPHIHAASNVRPGIPESVPGVPNAGPLEHSLGAIWGGTTTVVDFAPVPNEGDLAAGIHDYMSVWPGNAYTDYSTHCIYSSSNTPDAISRYGELVRAGFPSIKIFTTDTKPPEGAVTETRLVRRHASLRLHHHDRASLLAGKLHAVLQRPYTKGRDIYDLVWYLSDPDWPSPNLALLNAALRQTGWSGAEMTPASWRRAVAERLELLDWNRAASDVRPFLERAEDIGLVDRETALRLSR